MNNLVGNDFGNDVRIVVMMLLAVWCYQFIAKRMAKSAQGQPSAEQRSNDRRKRQRERMRQAHSGKVSRFAERFRSRARRDGEKMGLSGDELEGAVTAAVRMFTPSPPINRKDRTCVRIRMATPPPTESTGSFFGGNPELPEELAWPKDKQGTPMGFLAQIACADLPDALWSGAGPRVGYLRFFLPLKWGGWGRGAYVIHTLKRGVPREGPSLATSEWFSTPPGVNCQPRSFEVPRWPILVEPIRGDIDPINPFRLRDDPHNPPPEGINLFDIDDRATRPWSPSTLANVIRVAAERLKKAQSNPYRLSPKTDEQAQLVAQQSEGLTVAVERLEALYRDITTRQITLEEAIAIFDTITVPRLRWTANTPETPSRLVLDGVHRIARPDHHALASQYELKAALFEVERFDYLEVREDFPVAVADRLDRELAFIAKHETAGMGHIPSSYYHGHDMQGDEPITLLELPSSNLMGWMFGDLDRLCFTIAWNDLVAGDFSKVFIDVSNG